MYDLNLITTGLDENLHISNALLISDSGRIIVDAFSIHMNQRGEKIACWNDYLCKPSEATILLDPIIQVAVIPEPASYALMIVGVMFVGWKARRK